MELSFGTPESCCGSLDLSQSASFSDTELVAQARQGNEKAFAVLHDRHRRWLSRYIRGFVSDACDAEDLVQDAFYRAYASLPRYVSSGSFSSWIARIGRNAAIDHLRHLARSPAADPRRRPKDSEIRDVRFEPGRMLESRLVIGELKMAISGLPREQKEVIILRYFGNMRLEAISDRVGCPVGTVKSRLHAALTALASHKEVHRSLHGGKSWKTS